MLKLSSECIKSTFIDPPKYYTLKCIMQCHVCYTCMYMYVHVCTCMYMYIHVCTFTYMYARVRVIYCQFVNFRLQECAINNLINHVTLFCNLIGHTAQVGNTCTCTIVHVL